MKYFYDTEFLEDGKTIDLISIGIVADDGREYYAVNVDMPTDRIFSDTWLRANVWPSLPVHMNGEHPTKFLDTSSVLVKPKWVIANEVRDFLVGEMKPAGERDGQSVYFDTDLPELWAYYAAYDHVVLAQLFGKMIHLPPGIPMYTNDFKQELHRLGDPELPEQESGEHNALEDARHLKRSYDLVMGGQS